MKTLRELQRAFALALCDPAAQDICSVIVGAGLLPSQRVQIYRNNVLANLGGALEAVFPVVRRLVGPDFFDCAARRYVREVPSRSGGVQDFGADFPHFLEDLPEAASLPYLGDVARLEWACHHAFHAADAEAIAVEALGKVSPDRWSALRFVFHPATELLHSDYPVWRIWQVNQENWSGDETVNLDDGPSAVLVRRAQLEIELVSLSSGEHRLLASLGEQRCLEQALSEALDVEPGFDFGKCLDRHLRGGTFAGLSS